VLFEERIGCFNDPPPAQARHCSNDLPLGQGRHCFYDPPAAQARHCSNDPPPAQARQFIDNVVGFFKYQQPLLYRPPVYKLFPTAAWRVFEGYADRVTDCARLFVHKASRSAVFIMSRPRGGSLE